MGVWRECLECAMKLKKKLSRKFSSNIRVVSGWLQNWSLESWLVRKGTKISDHCTALNRQKNCKIPYYDTSNGYVYRLEEPNVLLLLLWCTEILMMWTRPWMKSMNRQKIWNKSRKLSQLLLAQQLTLMRFCLTYHFLSSTLVFCGQWVHIFVMLSGGYQECKLILAI